VLTFGEVDLIVEDDEAGMKLDGESDDGEATMEGGDTEASLSTGLDNIRYELCTLSLSTVSSISSSEIFVGEQLPPKSFSLSPPLSIFLLYM
jgi:thiamine pyrophosphokinase